MGGIPIMENNNTLHIMKNSNTLNNIKKINKWQLNKYQKIRHNTYTRERKNENGWTWQYRNYLRKK